MNTQLETSIFEKLNRQYPGKVSQSFLRVAALLINGRGTYEFNIQKNVGNSLDHDRKLDANDSFVATGLGIFLLAEDPSKPGTGVLQSYPNQTVFTTVANETDPNHLECVYNGAVKITENDRTKYEALGTRPMRWVGTTQQSAGTNKSEANGESGLISLTPGCIFQGSDKNGIQLNFPTFAGSLMQHATAATRQYLVFVAKGFLVTGSSKLGQL